MELTKEDWEIILKQANSLGREVIMDAAVHKGTSDLAREMIKSFTDDDKNKKLDKLGNVCESKSPSS